MSTRITRAIVLSLGIAVLFTAVYYWLINESGIRFKSVKKKPEGYSVQLSFHIGPPRKTPLDGQAVKQARAVLEDRLKKMGWEYTLKPATDNKFELSIDKVEDRGSATELLSGSGYLEMTDMYRWNDMKGVMDASLGNGNLTPFKNLFALMSPASPYQAGGQTTFPAYIGLAKATDTSAIRLLLESPVLAPRWPADARFLFGKLQGADGNDKLLAVYAIKNTVPRLTNQHIVHAEAIIEGKHEFGVFFNFDAYGTVAWERMTSRNVGRPVAICLNNKVISAPVVNQPIHGGSCRILLGPDAGSEYCRMMSILLTSRNLEQPVQVLHAGFTPIRSGPSQPVKYALMFILSFALAIGIQLLVIRLSKI